MMSVLTEVLNKTDFLRILRGVLEMGGEKVPDNALCRQLHGWGINEMSGLQDLGLLIRSDRSRPGDVRLLTITDKGREFLSQVDAIDEDPPTA